MCEQFTDHLGGAELVSCRNMVRNVTAAFFGALVVCVAERETERHVKYNNPWCVLGAPRQSLADGGARGMGQPALPGWESGEGWWRK